MLSKVAYRIYWMSRYLERAENTARMINAYYQLVLDLPAGLALPWDALLQITASEGEFGERYSNNDERSIIRFLQADRQNPGSIRAAIRAARENVRTTRDVLPAAVWESVNELYLFVEDQAEKGVARRRRYEFLIDTVKHIQQITGLLNGSLSRDQAHSFHLLGRYSERADMTTRILDVSTGVLLARRKSPLPFDSLLWMNVLKSLSALEMYRWHMGPRIEAGEVIRYLFADTKFPRSVAFCLQAIKQGLAQLPGHEGATRAVNRIGRRIKRGDFDALAESGLHDYIDLLQAGLMQIDQAIYDAWFEPDSRR